MISYGVWSALGYYMLWGGCFYVLASAAILVKSEKRTLRHGLLGAFKFFRIGTASISQSTGRGEVRLGPMIVTVVCCLALITVPMTIALAKYFNRYPIYTIGCDRSDEKDCTVEEMVKIVTKDDSPLGGWTYRMAYKSVSMGHLEITARFCPDYKPPFDPGDYAIFIRYEDRFDQGCWSLKPDAAGTSLRRVNNRTDSEIKNERE